MSGLGQVLVFIAVGYAAIVVLVFLLQRQMMYPAGGVMTTPAEVGLSDVEEISVTTKDGLKLRSWYAAPAPGRPTVVYFHGNAGTIADRAHKARLFAGAGIGMLLVEYRGYGGNPGSPTESGLYADGRANLAWLAAQGGSPSSWVLYGESLGTGVAVGLAWEQAEAGAPVAGLILEAPFTSMADAAQHHYPYLPARWLTRDRYPSLDRIPGVGAPLMIIHGLRDRVVPVGHGKRLFAAAREPKQAVWLEHAGHNDVFDHDGGARVLAFIEELMR